MPAGDAISEVRVHASTDGQRLLVHELHFGDDHHMHHQREPHPVFRKTEAPPAGLWVRHLFVFPCRSIELLPNQIGWAVM